MTIFSNISKDRFLDLVYSRTSVTIGDQLVTSALNFCTSVFIGRVIGADGLGWYVVLFSTLTLLVAFFESFLSSPFSIIRQKLNSVDLSEYVGSILIYYFFVSMVLAAIAYFTCKYLLPNMNIDIDLNVVIAGVWAFSLLSKEMSRRLSIASFVPINALLVNIVTAIFQSIFFAILLISDKMSLSAILIAAALSNCLALVVWWMFSRLDFKVAAVALKRHLAPHLSLGVANASALLTFIAQLYIAPWLLAAHTSAENVGIFAACQTLVMLTNPLTQGLANKMMPEAASLAALAGRDAVRLFSTRSVIILFLALTPFVLVLSIFGDQLLRLVYGAEFQGHSAMIVALALAAWVRTASMGHYIGLWSCGLSYFNSAANLLGLLVVAVALVPLFSTFGILGAGIAVVLGDTTSALLRATLFLLFLRPTPSAT